MKVKTLRDYLIGLPEEFDDFFVKMTKHETDLDYSNIKRSVENIHATIMRVETKEVFLLDETGADWFENVGNRGRDELDLQITPKVEGAPNKDNAFNMQSTRMAKIRYMKLYTEEQVIRAIELSDNRSIDEVLAGLIPIELPSEISDNVLFEQATVAMEEIYGSGCSEEISSSNEKNKRKKQMRIGLYEPLFSINNKWFYFDVTKVENAIFSRRNGYRGKIIFGYSVLFYFKKQILNQNK